MRPARWDENYKEDRPALCRAVLSVYEPIKFFLHFEEEMNADWSARGGALFPFAGAAI